MKICFVSAGSRFWQGATFEVKKSESPGEGGIEQLETIIPSDLEGAAFIQVTIRKIPGKVPPAHRYALSLHDHYGRNP